MKHKTYPLNYTPLIAKFSINNSYWHKKLRFDSFLALKKLIYGEELLLLTTNLLYLIRYLKMF